MVWTIVTFVVTLLVLRKIAWSPILASLDDREKRIHDALSQAEKAGKDAEEAIAQARADSSAALRRSDDLVKQARVDAEHLRAKMIAEAKTESQKVLDDGLRRLEAEQRAAMQEVRHTAADLAVRAAARLVQSSMTADQQRQIVEEFLRDLPSDRVH
jgi:F-type H+-transporting ATPase subunit b